MLLAFPHGITVRGGGMVILLVIRTELGGKAIFLLKRKKPCDVYFISCSFHITIVENFLSQHLNLLYS